MTVASAPNTTARRWRRSLQNRLTGIAALLDGALASHMQMRQSPVTIQRIDPDGVARGIALVAQLARRPVTVARICDSKSPDIPSSVLRRDKNSSSFTFAGSAIRLVAATTCAASCELPATLRAISPG